MIGIRQDRIIAGPYLVFIGDVADLGMAKTGAGLRDWARDRCAGQWRMPGGVDLGLTDLTIAEAAALGVRTLVIGIAPIGGKLSPHWLPILIEALEAGLDLAAGLHERLADEPELAAASARTGRRLTDVRVPPAHLPTGTGRKRSGRRLLTVGTDCAVGKKYTALAIARELAGTGGDATFRPTGQTGILLTGEGIPMDAVVADFLAGAAEQLSPDAAPDHWDIIEGQGALHHPAYAGVTLGLLHGSQPDALVLCHDVARHKIGGLSGYPVPAIADAMHAYLAAARLTNRDVRFVGLSYNTSSLDEAAAREVLDASTAMYELPSVDPLRFGVQPITAALMRE